MQNIISHGQKFTSLRKDISLSSNYILQVFLSISLSLDLSY